MTSMSRRGNYNAYRILPTSDRRPASGQAGSLGQQITAIYSYLDALEPGMTATAKERLWTVCHSLACHRPIPMTITEGRA